MAQNEQRRSQPRGQLQRGRGAVVQAAAHDAAGRRGDRGQRRVVGALGDRAAAVGGGSGGAVAVAGHRHGALGRLPVHRAQRQQRAAVARDVRDRALAVQDRVQPGADVLVVVEAQDRVGLRQRLGELLAVALGQAADGDDGLGLPARVLRLGVRRGDQRVDRVLLRGLDEPAGVDHRDVRAVGILDQIPAVGREPAGQLLGVHVVAGAAQRDQGHGAARGRGGSRWATGCRTWPPGYSARNSWPDTTVVC